MAEIQVIEVGLTIGDSVVSLNTLIVVEEVPRLALSADILRFGYIIVIVISGAVLYKIELLTGGVLENGLFGAEEMVLGTRSALELSIGVVDGKVETAQIWVAETILGVFYVYEVVPLITDLTVISIGLTIGDSSHHTPPLL